MTTAQGSLLRLNQSGRGDDMSSEKLTTIIGIRVYPSWKKQMMEEAKERGKTLSQYLYDLIEIGWERKVKKDVKQEMENEAVIVKQR
jgi:hypothetical protein